MSGISGVEIAIAARWWADHLRKGNPSRDAQLESGAMSIIEAITADMAGRYTSEQADEFERVLNNVIIDNLRYDYLEIAVDYDPCGILMDAGEAAGIEVDLMTFPWKTRMRLEAGSVTVREGYGGERLELMPKPKEASVANDVL